MRKEFMKRKKLFLPAMILVVTVIAMFLFAIINGITKKPVITEKEFPFAITYQINGEMVEIKDVYKCSFDGIGGFASHKERNYIGNILGSEDGKNVNNYIIYQDEKGVITLETNMYPDYLMGDAKYDYYTDGVYYRPCMVYKDYEGRDYAKGFEISEYNTKIISWKYPEPIENTFKFSHISGLTGKSMIVITAIAFIAVLASIFLVKKESDVVYTRLDKIAVVGSFVMGLLVIPFSSYVVYLSDIVGVSADLMGQITYCIPAMMTLGLAASISLRRKGYRKAGFVSLLISLSLFAVIMFI